jgi:alpha-glucosidase (family GH31 glycosyl hydrolase)
MKINIFVIVLLMLFTASIGFGKSEIKNNQILLYQNDYTISIGAAGKNLLNIKVSINGKTIKQPFFKIEKKLSPIPPLIKDNGFTLGLFQVKESENGFTIYKNNQKLYSSAFSVAGESLIEEKQCFDKEYFYGIGEASSQLVSSRKLYRIYQEAQYGNQALLYIPFFFSNAGDAFYYNANGRDTIKFRKKKESAVSYTTKTSAIDYYYYFEPNLKELVSRFYTFSNSQSMLPKWAFGYIQSKYGYKSEKEVYEIVKKFKQYDIPISAIVLDLQWFKKMGDLDYDLTNWPQPEKMDQYLEKNGIKLLTISEPFYTKDSRNYKEFEKAGLFAKDKEGNTKTWKDWWCFGAEYGAIVNPIAQKALAILGSKYIAMLKRGIDAFWTDLGEPESVPAAAYFNDLTELEFHNFYNYQWSQLIYNAVKREFPDKRLFILSRSGFTGSAKYGVSIWSGDVSSSFDALAKQPTIGLNSGLVGFSYWGSDVGGFESHKQIPEEELFIRWMQFGAFSPIFRPHGSMSSREPWIHGEKAMNIIKYFIKLRYKLMPYIYSTAYQTYRDGIPMMRPLFFQHPQDTHMQVTQTGSQYYFGDSLMVAPVVEAASLEPETSVYLPKGTWYDFYTYEKILPGTKTFKANITRIPVYIKAGAIIPLDENGKPVILLVPGDQQSSFTWYDDDGVTDRFKKGDFEAIQINLDKKQVIFTGVKKPKDLILKILNTDGKLQEKAVTLKKGRNQIVF